MARYPGTESERRIEPALLKRQATGIFTGFGSEPDVPPGPRCVARPLPLMERAEPCAFDRRGMLLKDKSWPVRLFAIGFLSPHHPPTLSGLQRTRRTRNS